MVKLSEQVQDFTYLGASINSSLDGSKEIKKRLAIARAKLTDMNSLSIKIKLRLLHSLIFPVATYGCEAWTIKKTDSQRINSFEMWCYRRILQVSWSHRINNSGIYAHRTPYSFCPLEEALLLLASGQEKCRGARNIDSRRQSGWEMFKRPPQSNLGR